MRRHSQIVKAAALVGWLGCCLFLGQFTMAVAAESLPGAAASVGRFDRAALEKELSQPLESLEQEPTEALRAHVQRLGDFHFALELAVDVSPEEQRALSERIMSRVGQVGLLIRQRMAEPHAPAKSRPVPVPASAPPRSLDLGGVLLDNSGLLVRLLGGLVIAFALGYLVGGRHAVGKTRAVARKVQREEPPAPLPSEAPSEGRPPEQLLRVAGVPMDRDPGSARLDSGGVAQAGGGDRNLPCPVRLQPSSRLVGGDSGCARGAAHGRGN